MRPRLGDLQSLLYRLITATNGVEDGLVTERKLPPDGICALVRGNAHLSAVERVEIYANMYFYRLLDAIREDFPATFGVLGDANFHNLITAYLIEYPPSDPSIGEASRHLGEFARNSPSRKKWPFVADLIRLERAMVEVFLAPDAQPLGVEEMRAIPTAQWCSLRIAAHPALQVLDCEWRVEEIVRAIAHEQPFSAPARDARTILVWRRSYSVSFRALDDLEQSALRMVGRGYPFGAVCEATAAERGDSATPAAMSRMLMRWLSDGVLVRMQS